jgi:hypothetical protein
MKSLRLASCMAENTEGFCLAIANYVRLRLGVRCEYVAGIPWQERERRFDEGEIRCFGGVAYRIFIRQPRVQPG